MWKKLKSILGIEEEAKIEKIKLDNLSKWFDDKADLIVSSSNNRVKDFKEKINSEIEKTKENIETLKKAKLQNPDITEREKQFMKGNREAYCRKVFQFLDMLDIPNDVFEAEQKITVFDDELVKFSKSTHRPYTILQEFFSHESGVISLNIANINHLFQQIKTAKQETDTTRLEVIKQDIKHLSHSIKHKKELGKELEEKQKQAESLDKDKTEIEKELEKLKKSKDFKEYENLKEKRNDVMESTKKIDQEIIHNFAILEKALRKYSRIILENADLLEKYVEDPVRALMNDNDLEIKSILEGADKNIESLGLKDRKLEKTKQVIAKMDNDYLNELRSKKEGLDSEEQDLITKINENSASKKLSELNERLDKALSDRRRIELRIGSMTTELEKINIGKIKQDLENEIGDVSGNTISISLC